MALLPQNRVVVVVPTVAMAMAMAMVVAVAVAVAVGVMVRVSVAVTMGMIVPTRGVVAGMRLVVVVTVSRVACHSRFHWLVSCLALKTL